jgi:hypothetical protein
MAITRTQIAKQLLAQGGRTGFRVGTGEGKDTSGRDYGGGVGRSDRDSQYGGGSYDSSQNVSGRGKTNFTGRDPTVSLTEDPVTTAQNARELIALGNRKVGFGNKINFPNIFPTVKAGLNLIKVPQGTFMDQARTDFGRALGPQTVNMGGMDRGGDLPYWAQLGFSSEEEYLNALRAQALSTTEQGTTSEDDTDDRFIRFRADGGRIGFRGGDAARSDAASGRNAGRADPGGGVDDRSTRGQTAVNEAAIMMARMQNQNKDRMTNPRFTEKFPTTSPVFANFNKMAIDKMIAENLDDDENQTITAGAVDASDLIRNMPEFKQKISDTVSGIMANPDIANLGKTNFAVGGLADGGPIGGEYDFESARQMYGLGKLVKKVTRTVKKIAKSPIGKAALLYTGAGALGNLAGGSGLAGAFKGFTSPSTFLGGVGNIFSKQGLKNIAFGASPISIGGNRGVGEGIMTKGTSGLFGFGGEFSPLKAFSIASALPLLGIGTGDESEEEAKTILDNSGFSIEDARNSILAAARDNYKMDFRARGFRAEGGIMRAGYQEGSKEPVAKKTMPLLDMGGKEMDLREDGGFVPIGRMEKADDVPARLSKNEFVFTADAVRNAGDGDVDKGAEVMYNMMKNLESGGNVSEESQGLEGARRMFQTSQRLEEVL